MTKEEKSLYDKKYRRTKKGLITRIYGNQCARINNKNWAYGVPTYTKKELNEWLYSQKLFHELYTYWKSGGYKKYDIPSVDRINDYKGYSLDNIQLMTWKENENKGHLYAKIGLNNKHNKSVALVDNYGNILERFHSVNSAARKLGLTASSISCCCRGVWKQYNGKRFIFVTV